MIDTQMFEQERLVATTEQLWAAREELRPVEVIHDVFTRVKLYIAESNNEIEMLSEF